MPAFFLLGKNDRIIAWQLCRNSTFFAKSSTLREEQKNKPIGFFPWRMRRALHVVPTDFDGLLQNDTEVVPYDFGTCVGTLPVIRFDAIRQPAQARFPICTDFHSSGAFNRYLQSKPTIQILLLQRTAFPCIIKDRLSMQTGGMPIFCVVRSRTTDAGKICQSAGYQTYRAL